MPSMLPRVLSVGDPRRRAVGSAAFGTLVVVAGSYLGLVRSSSPLDGTRRRAVDAGVVACVAAVVSLAFRNSLWWIVGSDSSAAGTAQFAALLAIAILVAFVAVFGAESMLGSHFRN